MNLVCFGDSITEAGPWPMQDRWPVILQGKLNQWRPNAFNVVQKGTPGATTAIGFDRIPLDLLPNLPATILVEFGGNDCTVSEFTTFPRVSLVEYEKNLRAFHELAVRNGGRAIFIVMHTILHIPIKQGNGKFYNDNLAPYRPMVIQTAKSLGASYIDLPKMMEERHIDLHKFLTEDKIHLTVWGNHRYAEMVFDALKTML